MSPLGKVPQEALEAAAKHQENTPLELVWYDGDSHRHVWVRDAGVNQSWRYRGFSYPYIDGHRQNKTNAWVVMHGRTGHWLARSDPDDPATRQLRYAAENDAKADRLEAAGFPAVGKAYRDAARMHRDAANRR